MRILAFLVALAGVGFGAWNYWEAQQALRVARAAVKLSEELEAANRKGSEVGQVLKHFRQHGIPERKAQTPVGGHSAAPRAREADGNVPGPDSGPSVEGGDAIGEAVGEDEYGEALARRIGGFAGDWEVYKTGEAA